ncbi:MAG: citrate synthase [Planctomycetota bacterium]|nr:citrate synthase [Planctomycetota bacterium]
MVEDGGSSTPVADSVELILDGKTVVLPLLTGSEGEKAIDVAMLRKETGLITLDHGYVNTGSCTSDITFIDGEKGILRYRGYPIEELAEKSTFLEVSWLLLYGELPTQEELETFTREVTLHTMLHEDFGRFFDFMPKNAHPMPVCAAAVGALSTFYREANTEERRQKAIRRLLAKMPTIAAYSYKHSIGQPRLYPRNDLDYCSNYLRLVFGNPAEDYEVDPVIARALDQLLILHADHEQNCSTSTVRMVGSSGASLYAAISAGIMALWGHLHGGANQRVIEMLERIAREEGGLDRFIARAKDKDGTTRLMGFGHRVYKNYDPRAAILKKTCKEVIGRVGGSSELLDIAQRLEEIALSDEYFVERNLYPNVDFYSGIIYQAIGIPVNMFTVMFVLGRLPGWLAQFLEMRHDPNTRIGRPRQVYTGSTRREYLPIAKRA